MKRKILSFTFTLLVVALSFSGCGGPGSPGSDGSENTGVILEAIVTPFYLGGNTNNVDVIQDLCDPGPPPEFEPFTDHGAVLTVNARLINPNPAIRPGTLFIEKYSIVFSPSTDSIGTPPIEFENRFGDIPPIVPPQFGSDTSTTTATLILIDVPRKDKYVQNMSSGQFVSAFNNPYLINNYTATYRFEGKNEYGESFSFIAQTNFAIGHYDYCN